MPSGLSLPSGLTREPRLIARTVLGILLFANLVAAFIVFRPFGGSAEDVEAQLTSLRNQVQQRQIALQRTRLLVAKMDHARMAGSEFVNTYFANRHTLSSNIEGELNGLAKESGIVSKGSAFVFEPVEGSDSISMMTINANYEGLYNDLLQLINRLDRSNRFLIIESLQAAPQQGSPKLNIAIKMITFVKEAPLVQ
jgi:type IV pilus assembly protein PilO